MGDLTDREVLESAIAGMDAVVHLAATPNVSDFHESLLPNNVIGLYNVCDLSRAHAVRRLVLTNSIQVTMGLEVWGKRPVRIEDGTAPINHYALTKVWAESIGEMYARVHGMSVIVGRPGWVPRHDRDQIDASPWDQCCCLSPNDAGRLFALTVEVENVKFAIILAQSRGKQFNAMDLTAAREIVGFEPSDTWPDGMDEDAREVSERAGRSVTEYRMTPFRAFRIRSSRATAQCGDCSRIPPCGRTRPGRIDRVLPDRPRQLPAHVRRAGSGQNRPLGNPSPRARSCSGNPRPGLGRRNERCSE